MKENSNNNNNNEKNEIENKDNKNDRFNDQAFWDILVHKKKRLTMEEYTEVSKNLSPSQLYTFAKKVFSSLALCGMLMYLIVYLCQTLIYSFVSIFVVSNDFLAQLSVDISHVTFALVAFPVLYSLTAFIPKVVPKQRNLPLWQLILFGIASLGLVYVGNLIGSGLAEIMDIVTGVDTSSPVNTMVDSMSPMRILIYVIIFPAVFEELIFRKLIIDRTAFFGETASVLFSALFFALYHMNLYQFFYAFMVGYLFGIIYIKTGKLTCTITLHGFINFLGAALPAMLGDNENFTIVYNIVFMCLGIAGMVVIFLGLSYAKSKNGRYTDFTLPNVPNNSSPISLKGKSAVKSVIFNPGMIIFLIFATLRFLNVL